MPTARDVREFGRYLGDGVYMLGKDFDGYHVWLVTFNGMLVMNAIAFDDHTLSTFLGEIKRGGNKQAES